MKLFALYDNIYNTIESFLIIELFEMLKAPTNQFVRFVRKHDIKDFTAISR